jgi:hypothetical protein
MFRDAKLADLIEQSPCVLDERHLGPLIDKDPEWRSTAVFTHEEAETIISDARSPAAAGARRPSSRSRPDPEVIRCISLQCLQAAEMATKNLATYGVGHRDRAQRQAAVAAAATVVGQAASCVSVVARARHRVSAESRPPTAHARSTVASARTVSRYSTSLRGVFFIARG